MASNIVIPENWMHENNYLFKNIFFKDFAQAVAFIVQLAFIAEKLNHHPIITLDYNKVTLKLFTKETSSITEKDIALANAIDELINIYNY